MTTDHGDRRRLAVLLTVAAAVVASVWWLWPTGAQAPGAAQAPGPPEVKGKSQSAPGKALRVSVRSVSPVAPGRSGALAVEVHNPHHQDVLLTGLTGTVTGVTSGTRSGIPRCDAAWIRLGVWEGAQLVAKQTSSTLALPVSFDDKAGINQDNCKGVEYSIDVTASGRKP